MYLKPSIRESGKKKTVEKKLFRIMVKKKKRALGEKGKKVEKKVKVVEIIEGLGEKIVMTKISQALEGLLGDA
jgi:hypothetical protein